LRASIAIDFPGKRSDPIRAATTANVRISVLPYPRIAHP
jgi:hypothetical protein